MSARRVVYIAGWIYSGTTLLGRLLGECDGHAFGGELRYYWRLVRDPEARCGCGRLLRECPHWQAVGEATAHLDLARIEALDERLLLNRRTPLFLLALRGRGPLARDLREYRSALRVLYDAVARAAGTPVIVDSSKSPQYALALAGIDGVDVRVIQLVRDPRGVLHSRLKRARPLHPALVLAVWDSFNAVAEVSMRSPGRRLLLRYEDFVDRPHESLARIAAFTGGDGRCPFLVGTRAELRPSHSVEGNRMRFRSGPTEIRLDDEWERKLPPRWQAVALSLTWPLLLRYGYPLVPRRRS